MEAAAIVKKGIQYLVVSTLVFVIAATRASGDDAASTFLGRTSSQWLQRLESDQPAARAEAAWAIAQVADHHPLSISKLITHDDVTVAYWGVRGLKRIVQSNRAPKDVRDSARETLHAALTSDAVSVRIVAAEALCSTDGCEQALPVLVEAMSHPQDAVRIQAVAALENFGEAARPAEQTLRAATSDSSEYVKRISTRALQKLDAGKR